MLLLCVCCVHYHIDNARRTRHLLYDTCDHLIVKTSRPRYQQNHTETASLVLFNSMSSQAFETAAVHVVYTITAHLCNSVQSAAVCSCILHRYILLHKTAALYVNTEHIGQLFFSSAVGRSLLLLLFMVL